MRTNKGNNRGSGHAGIRKLPLGTDPGGLGGRPWRGRAIRQDLGDLRPDGRTVSAGRQRNQLFRVAGRHALGILLGAVAGLYVAAFGYRRTLVWALWAGAAMSAVQALYLPFGLFLASRVVEGLSHLGIVVAGPVLIAQLRVQTAGRGWP